MFEEFLASGTLNIVYALCVIISSIFVAILLLGAEVGDALDLDLDVDGDVDSGIDFLNISPFALATFASTFGIVGLFTRIWFDMAAPPSIMWALAFGLIVGGLGQAFFIFILSPSKSSHFSLNDDAVGREAEVVLTIPSDGLGEIAYDNKSGRVKLGARSASGKQIGRGQFVKIERINGRIALVHTDAPIE